MKTQLRIGAQVLTFDSKHEAKAFLLLHEREKDGLIFDLKRQVEYELIPRLTLPDGHIQRKTVYKADFTYIDHKGQTHVVDAKGMKTDVYKLKKKLMYAVHKIVIEEV